MDLTIILVLLCIVLTIVLYKDIKYLAENMWQ